MDTSLSIWELAHPDGTSIFVRHSLDAAGIKSVVFGPFVFITAETLQQYQGTHGPMNLLRALEGKDIRAQQISLDWVTNSARTGFGDIQPDIIVIGELLIPLTTNGSNFADT